LPGSPNDYLAVVEPRQGEDFRMPTWVWILLIVLLVLVLFGGVGYGRRGV
jgi:type VI protein secretion system component VasF